MIHAIILAGGRGTRFWPLSRQNEPKQFLRFYSNRPMIEETISRISRLIDRGNIHIATNKIYHKKIGNCLKKLGVPGRNVFFEPEGKSTLPPIGLLSKRILAKDPQAVIIVLPSDHYIKHESRFLKILRSAVCASQEGRIVTLGIRPDRPETGYGYIKTKPKAKNRKENLYEVDRFIEKPGLSRAKKLIRDKRFYWNAGIFIFRPDTLLEEISRFAPREYAIIQKIYDGRSFHKLWPKFRAVSIDYAVMERTEKLFVIPADVGWLDLGSWEAVRKLSQKDRHGNIVNGNCIDVGSRDTMAWSEGRLLATVGLKDIIVVNTKEATLVCAKDRAQEVRKVVEILRQKKLYTLI